MRVFNSFVWQLSRMLVSRQCFGSVVTVVEYPKAGGTWIGKVLASCLDIPFVGGGVFLPVIPCVIRTHWVVNANLAPCVVVIRDPRDVMVSLFHHRIKNMSNTPLRQAKFDQLFEGGLEITKIKDQMNEFVNVEFNDPRYGAHVNWSSFADSVQDEITKAQLSNSSVILVKYEDMISDPSGCIQAVLQDLGYELPLPLTETALRLHDKSWGNKNYVNNPNETTHVRSANTGGWRSVFNCQSGRTLAGHCNPQLLQMGYEVDEDWWKKLDGVDAKGDLGSSDNLHGSIISAID